MAITQHLPDNTVAKDPHIALRQFLLSDTRIAGNELTFEEHLARWDEKTQSDRKAAYIQHLEVMLSDNQPEYKETFDQMRASIANAIVLGFEYTHSAVTKRLTVAVINNGELAYWTTMASIPFLPPSST